MANINKIGPVGLIPHRQTGWFDRWVRGGALDGLDRFYETNGCQDFLKAFRSVDRGVGELLKSAAALVDVRTYLGMAGVARDAVTYLARPDRKPFVEEFPNLAAWFFHPRAEYEKVVRAAEETYLNPALWWREPFKAFDSFAAAAGQSVIPGAMLAFGFRYQIANGMTVREFAADTKAMVREGADWLLPPPSAVAVTPSGVTASIPLAAGRAGRPFLGPAAALRASGINAMSAALRRGRAARVSDLDLAEALEKFGGHQSQTARETGLSKSLISGRVKRAQPDSPLHRFQNIKGRKGLAPRVDDATLAEILEKYKGDRSQASREIGLSNEGITYRVRHAEPNSPLYRFKQIKGRGGPKSRWDDPTLQRPFGICTPATRARDKWRGGLKPRWTDEQIARVLKKHKGDPDAAAKELGYKPDTVKQKLLDAREGSPLYPYRNYPRTPSKRGRFKTAEADPTNKEIAAILKVEEGDRLAAAGELDMRVERLTDRIRRAPEDSELASFKRPSGWAPRSNKTRNPAPGSPSPVADPDVAARMRELAWITFLEENANILEWLKKGMSPRKIVGRPYIGSSKAGIVFRLESAPDGDPLVSYARQYAPRRVSDRRMATSLEKSGGKIRAAARRLGISFDVIETRLGLVNESSPLWSYRP